MRVWHSAWSWLKLIVAAESVAGNTRTGMLTRLIFMNPFPVGLAAMLPSFAVLARAFSSRPERARRTDYRSRRAHGSRLRASVQFRAFMPDECPARLNLHEVA